MAEKAAPAALGFRLPAEWEPQAAVWLSWPHRRSTWPGRFAAIPPAFARLVGAISRFEDVHVNAARRLQPRARRLCAEGGVRKRNRQTCRGVELTQAPDHCWKRFHRSRRSSFSFLNSARCSGVRIFQISVPFWVIRSRILTEVCSRISFNPLSRSW